MKFFCFILLVFGGLFISKLQAQWTAVQLDSAISAHMPIGLDSAEIYADQLLEIEDLDSHLVLNAYIAKAIVFKANSLMIEALAYNFSALEYAEALKDTARISVVYNNIGGLFQVNNDFELAEKYLLKSLDLEKKINNKYQLSIRYYNLGELYLHYKKYNKASQFFLSSLILEEETQDELGMFYAYFGLANVYLGLQKWEEFDKNMASCEKKIGAYPKEKLMFELLQMKAAFLRQNVSKALKIRNEIARNYEAPNLMGQEGEFYKWSHQILFAVNNIPKAYDDLNSYNQNLEQRFEERTVMALNKLALEFERSNLEAEQQATLLKNERLLLQEAISFRLYAYVLVCFLLLGFSLYIYFK